MIKVFKMEIAIASLIGLLLGVGGTIIATKEPPEPPPPVVVETHKGTEEAIKQLTGLDLTAPVCSPEYIETHTDLLCRELTCLQFTRGFDSQTGGEQCEIISNISNSILIDKHCSKYEQAETKQDCIELFFKRK